MLTAEVKRNSAKDSEQILDTAFSQVLHESNENTVARMLAIETLKSAGSYLREARLTELGYPLRRSRA